MTNCVEACWMSEVRTKLFFSHGLQDPQEHTRDAEFQDAKDEVVHVAAVVTPTTFTNIMRLSLW